MKYKVTTGILFVLLLASMLTLFLGLSFSMVAQASFLESIKTVDYENSSTPVGGIIWENTTWTLENSPYIITDTVQIPANVTLTIEPGVTVTKPTAGDLFLLHGIIRAHGTVDNKIIFDGGGNSNFFSAKGSNVNTFLDLDYCIIRNGASFWPPTGYAQYGHFSLKHSELTDLTSYSYLWYPGKDVHIEYNKFINTAGFSIGDTVNHYIRYNLFKGNRGFLVRNWASGSASQTIVKYNSFIDMDGIVLELPAGYEHAAMTATENYWGTNDTDVIDSMIYDKNDDITCAGYIDYLPILSEPHPATPIMLEDVRVDINGIFRKDDDGKWRCNVNITIRNESPRNVTIPWIYLNTINITYVDETFEELGISGNETMNYVIQAEQELSVGWSTTAYGFTKEPKNLWVLFKTPISEAYGTITLTLVIPEFPLMLILPLFMIATLLTVIIYRRKHTM